MVHEPVAIDAVSHTLGAGRGVACQMAMSLSVIAPAASICSRAAHGGGLIPGRGRTMVYRPLVVHVLQPCARKELAQS